MSRKQENSFGVVARTGFSLLALGFGSALFGALVVGPMLGKSVGQDRRSTARPATSETRLASTVLNNAASNSDRETSRSSKAEAEREEKSDSKSEFVEGPGTDVAISSTAGSYSGPTEDPDATSADEAGGTGEPERPKATVRSDPFTAPAPVRVEAPKPVEAPKERTVVEPEPPKRSERTERPAHEEHPRERATRREADTPREARGQRVEETPRERKSERREESTPAREERKSSRDRVAEEPTRNRTRDEDRGNTRTPSTRKSEKVETTRTAKAAEAPGEAEQARGEEAKLYRVRVGRVHPRETAEKLRDELKDSTGVEAFLVPVGEGFQIQTGAYKRKANADKIAATLRAGNFITVVQQDR